MRIREATLSVVLVHDPESNDRPELGQRLRLHGLPTIHRNLTRRWAARDCEYADLSGAAGRRDGLRRRGEPSL